MNENYIYGRVSEEVREKLAYLPTICDLLEMMKREYSDSLAIGDDNVKYTYAELYSRVAKRRNYINSLGVSKGGKVAVMSRNSLDSMELFLAITSAGYTMIMLPAQLDEQKLAGCVAKFSIEALFVSDEFKPLTEGLNTKVVHISSTSEEEAPMGEGIVK
ncbi:MAG: acyl--CoA ligase, partial [Lachnospiraceae bacterium]|nr:acyl--CoA ligase [Lachnospiraceae bacterium]